MKWGAVIIGFILLTIGSMFLGSYSFIFGLFVGFIVGYMAQSGALGGLKNAAVAGAFGAIVSGILIMIFGIFFGIGGFVAATGIAIIYILISLIASVFTMGIAGLLGGALAPDNSI
ncbi:MAG: DUF5518 domain-containing protein [Methanobacteriaceae archaeon]